MSSGKALAVSARQWSIKRSISIYKNIASRLIDSVYQNSVVFLLVFEPLLLISKVGWPSRRDSLYRDQFRQMQNGLTVLQRYEVIAITDSRRFTSVKSSVHIYKHKILVLVLF
jgi:hypothetical protein